MALRNKTHCGGCVFFKDESIYGDGICELSSCFSLCDDVCKFNKENISVRNSIKILHKLQKYRRGSVGIDKCPSPYLIGIAIDKAINVLRNIDKVK